MNSIFVKKSLRVITFVITLRQTYFMRASQKKSSTAKAKKPGSKSYASSQLKYGAGPAERGRGISHLEEPAASYVSRIRPIGNSKGIILNNQLLEAAGLKPDVDIVMQAMNGVITIMQTKELRVNTDLSTWDKQFKVAIKRGAKPEGDLFEGIENEFDTKEW